jgi:hypothetical protein
MRTHGLIPRCGRDELWRQLTHTPKTREELEDSMLDDAATRSESLALKEKRAENRVLTHVQVSQETAYKAILNTMNPPAGAFACKEKLNTAGSQKSRKQNTGMCQSLALSPCTKGVRVHTFGI